MTMQMNLSTNETIELQESIECKLEFINDRGINNVSIDFIKSTISSLNCEIHRRVPKQPETILKEQQDKDKSSKSTFSFHKLSTSWVCVCIFQKGDLIKTFSASSKYKKMAKKAVCEKILQDNQ